MCDQVSGWCGHVPCCELEFKGLIVCLTCLFSQQSNIVFVKANLSKASPLHTYEETSEIMGRSFCSRVVRG